MPLISPSKWITAERTPAPVSMTTTAVEPPAARAGDAVAPATTSATSASDAVSARGARVIP